MEAVGVGGGGTEGGHVRISDWTCGSISSKSNALDPTKGGRLSSRCRRLVICSRVGPKVPLRFRGTAQAECRKEYNSVMRCSPKPPGSPERFQLASLSASRTKRLKSAEPEVFVAVITERLAENCRSLKFLKINSRLVRCV